MEIHDLVSNPWIGDPASRLAATLPFLVNLRELDNRTCRLTSALWVAMQGHPTLARVPYLPRLSLFNLPVCPRPLTRQPLEIAFLAFNSTYEGGSVDPATFAEGQRLRVSGIGLAVDSTGFMDGATTMTHTRVAGLQTVFFNNDPDEVELEYADSKHLLELFALSPTVRTVVVNLGYESPAVFDIPIGRMLAAVPGLDGLNHPSLKDFWAGTEGTTSSSIFFGLSDANDDRTGPRSLVRLAVNADVVDRRPGRHDRIDIETIANAAKRLPQLEMLDVRGIDCDEGELVRITPVHHPAWLHDCDRPRH